LWKASGSKENRNPKFWLRQENTVDFIKTVATSKKVTKNHLLQTQRGRTGGTYAHWQIALAYAKKKI